MKVFLFKVDDRSVGATGTDKKVPIGAPSEASVAPEGEVKTIPGWSELISQSILTGLKFCYQCWLVGLFLI